MGWIRSATRQGSGREGDKMWCVNIVRDAKIITSLLHAKQMPARCAGSKREVANLTAKSATNTYGDK